MKVVFLKHVPQIGEQGEVKEVADGYAKNFLIPQKLALPASQNNIEQINSVKRQKEKNATMDLIKAEKLASRLEGMELIIKTKANDKGKLFGAIAETEISAALKKKSIKLDLKHFKINKHLKEVGEHEILISLDHGLEAVIKVIVEAE